MLELANAGLPPELEHFNQFHDRLDEARDEVKEKLKKSLRVIFKNHRKDVARLILSELKKPTRKAQKEIFSLVRGPVTRFVQKYFETALGAADKLSRHILDHTPTVRKSLEKSLKLEKQKEIRRVNRDILTMNLDIASEAYVLGLKTISSQQLFAGVRGVEVLGQIEANAAAPGRETGQFFNAVAGEGGAYLVRVADSAMHEAFDLKNLDQTEDGHKRQWRWVTFFTKSCPDCIDRHGQVGTYEDWQDRGLPRAGTTVCRGHCHCVIVPDSYEIEIKAPVARPQIARIPKPEREKQ